MRTGVRRERLIAKRPVSIKRHAVGAVFVELFVVVVVAAFAEHAVLPDFILLGIHFDQDTWIVRMNAMRAERISNAHHRDPAIAVEVLGRIFAAAAIAIVIRRCRVPLRQLRGRCSSTWPSRRARGADDVDRDLLQQLLEVLISIVFGSLAADPSCLANRTSTSLPTRCPVRRYRRVRCRACA